MSNPLFNKSGCKDTVAYEAIKNATKDECENDHKAFELIIIIKAITSLAGFELSERIKLRHKKSGREYK